MVGTPPHLPLEPCAQLVSFLPLAHISPACAIHRGAPVPLLLKAGLSQPMQEMKPETWLECILQAPRAPRNGIHALPYAVLMAAGYLQFQGFHGFDPMLLAGERDAP